MCGWGAEPPPAPRRGSAGGRASGRVPRREPRWTWEARTLGGAASRAGDHGGGTPRGGSRPPPHRGREEARDDHQHFGSRGDGAGPRRTIFAAWAAFTVELVVRVPAGPRWARAAGPHRLPAVSAT